MPSGASAMRSPASAKTMTATHTALRSWRRSRSWRHGSTSSRCERRTRLSVEDPITQTANTAQALLFDREGKPKGIDHYLAALTLRTLNDQPRGLDKQTSQTFLVSDGVGT